MSNGNGDDEGHHGEDNSEDNYDPKKRYNDKKSKYVDISSMTALDACINMYLDNAIQVAVLYVSDDIFFAACKRCTTITTLTTANATIHKVLYRNVWLVQESKYYNKYIELQFTNKSRKNDNRSF